MTFADRWTAAVASPMDAGRLVALAEAALDEGEERRALSLLGPAAHASSSASLWQWTGLLQRSLEEHGDALASFDHACRLEPSDPLMAHSRARILLEAGLPAVAAFEQASRLGQPSTGVILGLAGALAAEGQIDRAIAMIDGILERSPLWIEGHRELAQLRSLAGERERSTASLERAIRAVPADTTLWSALFQLNIDASDFGALDANVARARAARAGGPLAAYEAIAASESGDVARADRIIAATAIPVVWHLRHLIRAGRWSGASSLIDTHLRTAESAALWPYAFIVWRQTGDTRFQWLTGPDGFVAQRDIGDKLPPLDIVAKVLRDLHVARAEFLDQSVRGGTQTAGSLFARIHPVIRQVRDVIRDEVESFRRSLPPRQMTHPLLRQCRDRDIRFAGSWSVRLHGLGFHESHVHNQGWLSSALYVALPDGDPTEGARAGWLELGRPPTGLDNAIDPLHIVEPKPGRLVLFPSWLWHGTIPFAHGERLTIAFDVKPDQ